MSDVFQNAAERQAAYDFVEHASIDAKKVVDAVGLSGAWHCKGRKEVLLALDGSSLSVTDIDRMKDFGSVGRRDCDRRGLKVITALALTSEGGTLGSVHQEWWVRGERAPKKSKHRPPEERESWRWRCALEAASQRVRCESPNTNVHVLADREADASVFMHSVLQLGHDFTIRANGTRKAFVRGRRVSVRRCVEKQRPIAAVNVPMRARRKRPARHARVQIRCVSLTIDMRDRHLDRSSEVGLSVVLAKEVGRGRRSRLDWMLYTTTPVQTAADAVDVVRRYAYRWRIEDFHRAWKGGGGCVEDTQLRSNLAVIKWASLHTLVASRAERLKLMSRASPDLPATTELSEHEIRALLILKETEKRRTETIPQDEVPTLERAVRWIADLGGYVGAKSSGPPGTTVISRGLERVQDAAQLLGALISSGKLR